MKEKLESIINQINDYLCKYDIKNVIIGNSGGIDSALCIAILSKCNCNIISRYIHIESNKIEEQNRAESIAKAFNIIDHKTINFTEEYIFMESGLTSKEGTLNKIQQGNVKARIRMTYLYNLAHIKNGLVISTDNKTEKLLGFYTIHGADEGDLEPIQQLYKSEVYAMSKFMTTCEDFLNAIWWVNKEDKKLLTNDQCIALSECINAIPTDGLGISNSDLDQIDAKSYEEVDLTLMTYLNSGIILNEKVITRHLNTNFKRNLPVKINIY